MLPRSSPAKSSASPHTFSRDWYGDPAIYFRIVITDEAFDRYPLPELPSRIRETLAKDLELFDSEYSLYIPYFNFRTVAEQEKLKEPQWE
jgi:hypothetical protein